jgi:hypothetical protein
VRRGLMHWDAAEQPLDLLEARIDRLRNELALAALDGLIIYTNNVRPSAVHHLTSFTPYWSEGLLLVPMRGRLVFATALSNRVADWIRSTNPVSEVISTPRPGTLLGERLASDGSAKRVGILEIDSMPAELFDDLSAAAPKLRWVDGSAPFAATRRSIDAAERRMLARADALAVAAFDEARTAEHSDAAGLAGLIEQKLRLAGAEEVLIALAPDLAADSRLNRASKPAKLTDRFAVRISVAYKGSWIRRARTFASDGSVLRADIWFGDLIQGIEAGKPIAEQIAARLSALSGATIKRWMVEGCFGSYPLSVVASSHLPGSYVLPGAASFGVLTIELTLECGPWIGAAPFVTGKRLI